MYFILSGEMTTPKNTIFCLGQFFPVFFILCSNFSEALSFMKLYEFSTVLQNKMIRNENFSLCGEPAISLHSHTVPLVQWSTRLLPVMRDPGSIPKGVLT
jgi:hypothetical protein